MANFVEAAFNVTLKNPLRVCASQCKKALCHRIGAGPLQTDPVGVSIRFGFHPGIECKQIQGLLRSIDHGGNSERAHRLAVRFRNIHTSEGLRVITRSLYWVYCLCLLLW